MKVVHRLALGTAFLFSVLASSNCSQSGNGGGNGGAKSSGGTAGTSSSGGHDGSGGSIGSGGSAASGGTTSSGGKGSGGAAAGGAVASGGSGAGGVTSMGGASSGGAAAGGSGSGGADKGGSSGSGGTPSDAGRGGSSAGGSAGGGAGSGGSTGAGGSTMGAGGSGSGGSTSVTCPSPALKSGDTNQTIQVGSSSRSFVLHIPASYDGSKPAPFIIDFHGLGGSGPSERSGSPYPAQTDPDGVVMAFPTGLSGPSGPAWNVGPCCVAGTDDVAFAKAMVAQVQKSACIDPKRIYAVGFSMGGGMSHYIACHAADVFAAVAPAAFDLLKENVDGCTPTRPLTVISFRGTSDPIVPYAGGASAVVSGMPITFLGAKGTFAKWADIDKCTGSPSAEDSNGCSTYSTCSAGVEVVLCTKQGGSHEPGNASVAWPVLKRHTMP